MLAYSDDSQIQTQYIPMARGLINVESLRENSHSQADSLIDSTGKMSKL